VCTIGLLLGEAVLAQVPDAGGGVEGDDAHLRSSILRRAHSCSMSFIPLRR
jgi:hypothetical protein